MGQVRRESTTLSLLLPVILVMLTTSALADEQQSVAVDLTVEYFAEIVVNPDPNGFAGIDVGDVDPTWFEDGVTHFMQGGRTLGVSCNANSTLCAEQYLDLNHVSESGATAIEVRANVLFTGTPLQFSYIDEFGRICLDYLPGVYNGNDSATIVTCQVERTWGTDATAGEYVGTLVLQLEQ